jgi:hypothetical protein
MSEKVSRRGGDSRVLFALRSLGADVGRLPEIPEELAEWIAERTS